jgi:hypothetical protein
MYCRLLLLLLLLLLCKRVYGAKTIVSGNQLARAARRVELLGKREAASLSRVCD